MSLAGLKERTKELHNLNMIGAVLGWDQQTQMPAGGGEARAEHLAVLAKIQHQLATAEETGRLLEDAEKEIAGADYDSDDAALVRLARRNYDQVTKLPEELVIEMARTTTLAHETWAKARENDDFSAFQGVLEKIFDLTRQQADHLGYQDHPYDALLDLYEPGMTTAEVKRIFGELRDSQVPLIAAIVENKDRASNAILKRDYPIDRQREFGEMVVRKYGYDFSRGRQDLAVHPFCTSFSSNDVRITTRFELNWLPSALFGTMHESGHGMYEQGISQAIEGNILASGTSLGIHESQSRLWENVVGRSRGFWGHFYGDLQKTFPEALGGVDLETFYRSINASEPSFIRVEADEVTYNMHIMVRFDLETAVYEGKIAVKDLPEAWNAKYQEYLGITPPNNRLGLLQDVHWSSGIMGYFPTYALGNLLSLQFYEKAVQDKPAIPDEIGRGEFDSLREWMRDNIYQHGSKFKPQELVQRVTGTSIQTGPYLNYLKTKYSDIYGL